MLNWLQNNAATIIIAVILIAVLALIVRHLIKNKKSGKSSCGCGCSSCAMNGGCHKK